MNYFKNISPNKENKSNDKWLRILLPVCFIIVSMIGSNVFEERFTSEKLIQLLEVSILITITFEINWFVSMKLRNIHLGVKRSLEKIYKNNSLNAFADIIFYMNYYRNIPGVIEYPNII